MMEWGVRPMRHDGKIVWVICRPADGAAEEDPENREYWPRGECPAWASHEQSARNMARVLNELERLHRMGT